MNSYASKEITVSNISDIVAELGSINLRKADADLDPAVRGSLSFQHVMKLISRFTTLQLSAPSVLKWAVEYAQRFQHVMDEWTNERYSSAMVSIRFKQSVEDYLIHHVPAARDLMLKYNESN